MMRRLLFVLVAVAVSGCRAAPPSPHLVQRTELEMGSSLTLTAWTADETAANEAFSRVFAEFDRLDRLMSVWKPESDIVKVNAAAGVHPVAVSPDVIDVVSIARQVSEWTEGKFDITFGALSDVWKFDQDQDDSIPSAEAIAARLPFIDYRQLRIDPAAGTLFLAKQGMRAHLGGIGKGYAVDKAVAILREHGINDFMVQAGGDMYVGGRRGDRAWRLGINDPRGKGGDSFATIELSNETLSTSGDYERYFIRDGVRYHHILDPALGQPARGARSVTIVTKRAVIADGLSTGVFVLGPEKGMALIERLPDVEGVIVTSKNEVLVSSGLKGRVTLVHQPADFP
ncbi:MAG: FAD:protein FMN transferase [Acidobacteriaceae bacterium]|jgi:thiamine biosynthesis lipoprotein|nr:FAD:protein FMN transferase [Acidobacteriaceae bacterium]